MIERASTRRDVLLGSAGAAMGALALAEAAFAEGAGSHDGHGSHDGAASSGSGGAAAHAKLIEMALACVGRGEVCVAHCIGLMGKGDTSLEGCLRNVQAMMPMCATLARLAALDAPRLKELAAVCAGVCEDCEKECRKHEKHHKVCADCAESCAQCAKECRALIKA